MTITEKQIQAAMRAYSSEGWQGLRAGVLAALAAAEQSREPCDHFADITKMVDSPVPPAAPAKKYPDEPSEEAREKAKAVLFEKGIVDTFSVLAALRAAYAIDAKDVARAENLALKAELSGLYIDRSGDISAPTALPLEPSEEDAEVILAANSLFFEASPGQARKWRQETLNGLWGLFARYRAIDAKAPDAAPVLPMDGELPYDLRIPLHSLQADIDWLVALIIAEDDEGRGICKDSIRNRLSQIEAAAYRLTYAIDAKTPQPATQAADWYWCQIDPDESGDCAYQAMHAYRPRLKPVELGTSFRGPTVWGVMAPPLPDADDDSETAHEFGTQEEAQVFCDERKKLIEASPAQGGNSHE